MCVRCHIWNRFDFSIYNLSLYHENYVPVCVYPNGTDWKINVELKYSIKQKLGEIFLLNFYFPGHHIESATYNKSGGIHLIQQMVKNFWSSSRYKN